MDRKRSDDGVARVVAWHNRHPLAHHIEPEQVVSHGHVELPYRSRPGQPRSAWHAVFSEKFLPGIAWRRVVRWALAHGQSTPPAAGSGPLRQLQLDTPKARDEGQAELLWLPTAAVVFGRRQTRVLLSSTDPRAVLGRRIYSRPRQAAVLLLLLLLLTLGIALPVLRHAQQDHDDEPEPPVTVARAAPPASAAAEAEPLAPVLASPPAAALPASRVLPPPTPPQPRPPFAEAEVRRGRIEMPSLKPQLAEAARAAASAAGVALPNLRTAATPSYALALRRVRTQAESELMGEALKSLLSRAGPRPGLRVEAMPAGEDWRAVCWPFASREEAEKLREQLPASGQVIEVIVF